MELEVTCKLKVNIAESKTNINIRPKSRNSKTLPSPLMGKEAIRDASKGVLLVIGIVPWQGRQWVG